MKKKRVATKAELIADGTEKRLYRIEYVNSKGETKETTAQGYDMSSALNRRHEKRKKHGGSLGDRPWYADAILHDKVKTRVIVILIVMPMVSEKEKGKERDNDSNNNNKYTNHNSHKDLSQEKNQNVTLAVWG